VFKGADKSSSPLIVNTRLFAWSKTK